MLQRPLNREMEVWSRAEDGVGLHTDIASSGEREARAFYSADTGCARHKHVPLYHQNSQCCLDKSEVKNAMLQSSSPGLSARWPWPPKPSCSFAAPAICT